MRREGQQRHPEAPIRWLSDRLPGLEAVHRLGLMFDLVWLSAVWMHVVPAERQRAFRKLVTLLKPGGRLVMTLRHGPAPADRPMHEATAAEIERLGLEFGLITLRVRERPDRLGRSDVRWTLVCLQLPDDSTGALPLLRSVILNDSKSSTYKLALLRVIARVADSAVGLAAPGDGDRVRIPLGLVALYWIRMFKPLLQAGLPQTPTNKGLEGLGFVRDGFRSILHIPAQDLRIGASLWARRRASHQPSGLRRGPADRPDAGVLHDLRRRAAGLSRANRQDAGGKRTPCRRCRVALALRRSRGTAPRLERRPPSQRLDRADHRRRMGAPHAGLRRAPGPGALDG